MCRLYGYIGEKPAHLHCSLIEAENSIVKQSLKNADGWGIASYDEQRKLTLQKEPIRAKCSKNFEILASSIQAKTVLSHIRWATVGEISKRNTHPFSFQNWSFAHNGGIAHIEELRPLFLERIPLSLRSSLLGETDSEIFFFFLLANIQKAGGDLEARNNDENLIRDALQQSIEEVQKMGGEKSTLNTLLTNGKTLWGSRIGRPLFFIKGSEYTCTCGETDRSLFSITIATEKLTSEKGWKSFPENCVFFAHPSPTHISIKEIEGNNAE